MRVRWGPSGRAPWGRAEGKGIPVRDAHQVRAVSPRNFFSSAAARTTWLAAREARSEAGALAFRASTDWKKAGA